jgi:hypothetical protein
MRALCGAIITAGALIGLGLTAFGIGTRYQGLHQQDPQGNLLMRDRDGNVVPHDSKDSIGAMSIKFSEMDRGLTTVVVVLLIATLIGLATTFIGLMYHHYRRHHEFLHTHAHPPGERTSV